MQDIEGMQMTEYLDADGYMRVISENNQAIAVPP
jgi:hypothetical protein